MTLSISFVSSSDAVDLARKDVIASSLSILEALFIAVPTFVSNRLQAILHLCILDSLSQIAKEEKGGKISAALQSLISIAIRRVPPRPLFVTILQLCEQMKRQVSKVSISYLSHQMYSNANVQYMASPQSLVGALDILVRALRQCKPATVSDVYKSIFNSLLSIFNVRQDGQLPKEHIIEVERAAISAFLQMILRLNEGSFRPLFLRLVDWALIDLSDNNNNDDAINCRKTILFKAMDRMLIQVESIVVPYYAFLLDQAAELLGSIRLPQDLWDALIGSLHRALAHDNTGEFEAEPSPLSIVDLTFCRLLDRCPPYEAGQPCRSPN